MNLDRTNKKLAGLIQELQDSPETLALFREELDQAIKDHFSTMLEQADGEITPEILALAEELYELPVVNPMAAGLNITVPQLRVLLGRKLIMPCATCGIKLEIRQKRVKGGYALMYTEPVCKNCRETMEIEEQEQREAKIAERIQIQTIKEETDWLILTLTPTDALLLPQIKQHLLSYSNSWRNPPQVWFHLNYEPTYQLVFSGGCMFCGHHVFNQLLAKTEFFNPEKTDCANHLRRFWMKSYGTQNRSWPSDSPPNWPPLQKISQLLWRLQPENYFPISCPWPLQQRPLIFLCEEHLGLVSETHFVFG